MKTLIISPQAGMCNRFRAICSAIYLAQLSERKIYHSWAIEPSHKFDIEIISHMRESTFTTFFDEHEDLPFFEVTPDTKIDAVFSEWDRDDYWAPYQHSAIKRNQWDKNIHIERDNANSILNCNDDVVLLETSLTLKPSGLSTKAYDDALQKIYLEYFKPKKAYMDYVKSMVGERQYTGLHIRRTDHMKYVAQAHISMEHWISMIRDNIPPTEPIYLCSDDKQFSNKLINRLPNYQILSLRPQSKTSNKQFAFVELLFLSQSKKIYGTVASSFSKQAALMGGKPHFYCSMERPKQKT